jgi:hypothetical protein
MENNAFEYMRRVAAKQTEYGLAEGFLKKTGNYVHHTIIEDFNLPDDLFNGLEEVVNEINLTFGIRS